MKELKKQWYISVTQTIYERMRTKFSNIRLTDAQLSKIIFAEFGGETEEMHLQNIRRSQCNAKDQPYVTTEV